MFIIILTYVMSIVAVWSLILMGNKSKFGPIVGIANQFMWIYFVIYTQEWGLMIGVIAYTLVHIRNAYKWMTEKEEIKK